MGAISGWTEAAQLEDSGQAKSLLTHPSSKIKPAAFQAIARLGPIKEPKIYIEGITAANAKIRRTCAQVLKKMVEDVKPELILLLEHTSPQVQEIALEVLTEQSAPIPLKIFSMP